MVGQEFESADVGVERVAEATGDSAAGRHKYSDYEGRSRETRQHIMDVAAQVLIDHGYRGASTLKIQEAAGVSRGRLLHHYPSRDELLAAAAHYIAERRIQSAAPGERSWPADRDERIEAAVDAAWEQHTADYFWAATELWLAARHNDALAEVLLPREQAIGAAVRVAVDGMFGAEVAAHPIYPQVRELLLTSMRGVILAYAFDPRRPEDDGHLPMWRALARRELAG